jgi:hypothetical protein
MTNESFYGLNSEELQTLLQKFTHRPDEYNGHAKDGIPAKLLDKDKDDLVYWYIRL